jgi:hypothetical protein
MPTARKPLNFDLSNAAEPVPAAAASRPANQDDRTKEQRQQVGARIRAKTYRQLKARAALEGRKVQDLVELAVEKYLAEQPEGQGRP